MENNEDFNENFKELHHIRILSAGSHQTSQWSGGSTTELFIYPPTAHYADRNFDFRISSASVTDEQSVFTALPSVSRTLMLLEGQMKLE